MSLNVTKKRARSRRSRTHGESPGSPPTRIESTGKASGGGKAPHRSSSTTGSSLDPLDVYLSQVGAISMFSRAEEQDATRRLEEARQKLRRHVLGEPHAFHQCTSMVEAVAAGERSGSRVFLGEGQVLAGRPGEIERLAATLEAARTTIETARGDLRRRRSGSRWKAADPARKAIEDAVLELERWNVDHRHVLVLFARSKQLLRRMVREQAKLRYRTREGGDVAKKCTCEKNLADLEIQALNPLKELRRHVRESQRRLDEYEEIKAMVASRNLRLVIKQAARFQKRGLSMLDLIQEGNVGLLKSLDKFEASRGLRFSTYAVFWIRQSITRGIAEQSRTIRLPVHVTETQRKLAVAEQEFMAREGRAPEPTEVESEVDISLSSIRKALNAQRPILSLDDAFGSENSTLLREVIEDRREESPVEAASRALVRSRLQKILEILPSRTGEILKLRYGLVDGRSSTLEEVSRRYNVTRERVRQIEARGLELLRTIARRYDLAEMLDGPVAHHIAS